MKKAPVDKEYVIKLYLDGLSTKELSIFFDCSMRHIQKILKTFKYTNQLETKKIHEKEVTKKREFNNHGRLRGHLKKAEIEGIIVDFKNHMSNGDIAKKHNTSMTTVRKYTKPYEDIIKKKKIKLKEELEKFKTTREAKKGLIYAFKCTEDSYYIGKTTNLKARCFVHINDLKFQKHSSSILQRAYNKDPEKVLSSIKEVEILENNISFNQLDKKERYYQLSSFHKGYKVLGMSKQLLEELLYS